MFPCSGSPYLSGACSTVYLLRYLPVFLCNTPRYLYHRITLLIISSIVRQATAGIAGTTSFTELSLVDWSLLDVANATD